MGKKTFVLDTNVILHDSRAIYSFKEHDVCVPLEVIGELDKFKKGQDVKNFNAREFIRIINVFPRKKLFNGGALLSKYTKKGLVKNPSQNLGKIRLIITKNYEEEVLKLFPDTSNTDNLIINAAFKLLKEKGEDSVVLISNDAIMRLKAEALGIEAEDYRTGKVVDTSFLYKKVRKLKIPYEKMTQIEKEGVATKIRATENEPLILVSGDSSCLATYKEKKLHLIKKEKLCILGMKPKNKEQIFALNALLDPNISLVCLTGKAGTGKTILSLAAAIHLVGPENRIYEEILFTRQTISLLDRDQGFLPGDLSDKTSPFMKGLYDNLAVIKLLDGGKTKNKVEKLEKDKRIIIEPLSVIRGRSINRKIFIIDEAQNLTPKEIKAIITRAGEETKIILLGDISQTDTELLDEGSNGLSVTAEKMRGQKFFAHIVLQKSERSHLSEIAADLL